METVTLCCSLFSPKGDVLRVNNTAKWYKSLSRVAGVPFKLVLINDQSEESFDHLIPHIKPVGYCTDVQYFESPDRVGKAKQLNRVFPYITTKYVGIIDNDVILPPKWLHNVLVVLSVPQVATCGVVVEDWIGMGPTYAVYNENQDPVNYTYPQVLGGACVVWNKAKLKEEGLLWEGGGVYGHEDAEFNQRIARRVGKVASLTEKGYSISDKTNQGWEKWKQEQSKATHMLFYERMADLSKDDRL